MGTRGVMHVGAFGSSIKFDLRNSATNRTSQQRKADAALSFTL
jgi:hypothetical protein